MISRLNRIWFNRQQSLRSEALIRTVLYAKPLLKRRPKFDSLSQHRRKTVFRRHIFQRSLRFWTFVTHRLAHQPMESIFSFLVAYPMIVIGTICTMCEATPTEVTVARRAYCSFWQPPGYCKGPGHLSTKTPSSLSCQSCMQRSSVPRKLVEGSMAGPRYHVHCKDFGRY